MVNDMVVKIKFLVFLVSAFLMSGSVFAFNLTKIFGFSDAVDYVFNSSEIDFASGNVTLARRVFSGRLVDWRLNENSGIIVSDSSGNNVDGSISGAIWATGKYSYALSFDGVDDYVGFGDVVDVQNLTVEAWVYPKSLPGGGFPDDVKDIVVKYYWYYFGIDSSGNLTAYLYGTSSPGWHDSNTQLTLNQWFHVVLTHDGTNTRFYINGVLDKTIPNSGSISSGGTPENVFVGGQTDSRHFNGTIDEVVIYNRALTSGEILDRYNGKRYDYSTIETFDFEPVAVVTEWTTLASSNLLNNQSISFDYSIDGGESYSAVPVNGSLTDISTDSGIIRFRANLSGDGNSTPELYSITLDYKVEQQATQSLLTIVYDTIVDVWNYLTGWITSKLSAIDGNVTSIKSTVDTNLDTSVSSRAPSSTALSNAVWTSIRAGYLDNINHGIPSSTDYTGVRAGKLDNLDKSVSSSESSIRGVDNDTLKTISDQIDGITGGATASEVWAYTIRRLTNLDDTRSSKIDNLDTTISSRAPSSTALSNGVWTDAKAGYIDTSISSRASQSSVNAIPTNPQKRASYNRVSGNNAGIEWAVLVDTTGKGVLHALRITAEPGQGGVARITIDGIAYSTTIFAGDTRWVTPIITEPSTTPIDMQIQFKTSLKVEVGNPGYTGGVSGIAGYSIE